MVVRRVSGNAIALTKPAFDCETKAKDYAQSGITDYWVLDVSNRQLHVFREPTENGYQSEMILEEGASISPLQFPTCTIAVSEILPPIIGL